MKEKMKKKINLGEMYLSETIIKEVEKFRRNMLIANYNSDLYEFMKNASFSWWFENYLLIYDFKLLV